MDLAQSEHRTFQEEYFDGEETDRADALAPPANGKFFAVVCFGVVVAVSLAMFLSLS